MPEPRTNYVVACWMGGRRAEHKPNVLDRTSFLRAHIHALETLPHSLDQVTIVLAEGGDPEADAFAKGLTEIAGVPVKVLVRPNVGMSYAGWNLAYETFGDAFTHYIVVEDDYVPFIADFDKFLVDISDHYDTFVCGLATTPQKVAAISNGVIPGHVWKDIRFPSLNIRGADCQLAWSKAFHAGGHPIQEYLEYCSSPFWLTRAIRWYGHPSLPPLFVPVQAVGINASVTGGPHVAMVRFSKDGDIVPASPEAWEALKATPLDDPCWRGRFAPPPR